MGAQYAFLNAFHLGFPTSKGFERLVRNFKVMPLDYVIVNIESYCDFLVPLTKLIKFESRTKHGILVPQWVFQKFSDYQFLPCLLGDSPLLCYRPLIQTGFFCFTETTNFKGIVLSV